MTPIRKHSQLAVISLIAFVLTACSGGSNKDEPVAELEAKFSASMTSGKAPLLVNFNANSSVSPSGVISNYIWSFGNGTSGASNPLASTTYTVPGEYTVSLQISDGTSSDSTSKVITVTPENVAPTANFTVTTDQPRQPAIASFDASSSTDSDGTIDSFNWDFGDGSAAGSGETTTHTYTTQGNYTATLTITDSDGATATTTQNVVVAGDNVAPTATYTSLTNAALNVSFNASGSSDSDGSIQSYAWNFGDGTTGTGASPSHTYSAEGPYNVSLTVTDNEGLASQTYSSSITIWNAPTNIVIIGDSISQGSPGNPSFRYRFWKKLVDSGKAFDLVGSYDTLKTGAVEVACTQADCPDYSSGGHTYQFDPQHSASWGLTADQIQINLSVEIGNYPYDIALIHLGTNDLLLSQGTANAKADLDSIITRLRAGNPNVKIAIAQIIPMANSRTGHDQVTTLNGLIGSLVADSTLASPIIVVDQYSSFNVSTHTFDGVHPNTAGEELMATTWFNTIGPGGYNWIP